jgi:hypothetical protein
VWGEVSRLCFGMMGKLLVGRGRECTVGKRQVHDPDKCTREGAPEQYIFMLAIDWYSL